MADRLRLQITIQVARGVAEKARLEQVSRPEARQVAKEETGLNTHTLDRLCITLVVAAASNTFYSIFQ